MANLAQFLKYGKARPFTRQAVEALKEPTTLQTSVTFRSATYYFDRPVLVGRYLGTSDQYQPFVVSDREFNIIQVTPDSTPVASAAFFDYNVGAVADGTEYYQHGLMVNPYIPTFQSSQREGTADQGFDGILGVASTSSYAAGKVTYDHSLNKDPAAAGAYLVTVNHEASLVKSIRRAGLTTPSQLSVNGGWGWRMFDDWGVLHVVKTAPPLGAFPPSCCSLTKESEFTTFMRNKGALGDAFTLPSGFRTVAELEALNSFHTSFQPFFGWFGEFQRRACTNLYPTLIESSNYSRDYATVWSEWLAAIISQGPSAPDEQLNRALCFGIQLYGMLKRGYIASSGAGQWAGYKQFITLFAHIFEQSKSGIVNECLAFRANCTHQQFWVQPYHVGVATDIDGNHGIKRTTYMEEHVGRPHWIHTMPSRPPANSALMDSSVDTDYELNSAGYASFNELLLMCLLKGGPGGRDGAQSICNTNATNWTSPTPESASLAYLDRQRTFVRNTVTIYASDQLIVEPKWQNLYDLRRDTMNIPRWKGTPDAGTLDAGDPTATLTMASGYTGTFVVGERVLNAANTYGGTVVSWTTSTRKLVISDVVGFIPASGVTFVGQQSGATATHTAYAPAKQHQHLVSRSGGFQWDLTNLYNVVVDAGVEPSTVILEYQIQYSLDEMSWINVTSPGVTGYQDGLANGIKHYVRWRRRNSYGWSSWTVNHPRITGQVERMIVTPSGTASGTIANVISPKLYVPKYPAWWGPYYEEAPSTMDISTNIIIHGGIGYWTGDITQGFDIQHKRDGVNIVGATSIPWELKVADTGTVHGLSVTPKAGGTTLTATGVNIPAIPALPDNIVIDTTFTSNFKLYYEAVFNSFVKYSRSGTNNPVITLSSLGTWTVGETVVSSGGGTAIINSTSTSTTAITGQTVSTITVRDPLGNWFAGQTVSGLSSGMTSTVLYTLTFNTVTGDFQVGETVNIATYGTAVVVAWDAANKKLHVKDNAATSIPTGKAVLGLTSGASGTLATSSSSVSAGIPTTLMPVDIDIKSYSLSLPDTETTADQVDTLLRGTKNSNSPRLIGNLAATVPLTPLETYKVTGYAAVGVGQAQVDADLTLRFGNQRYINGNAAQGSEYSPGATLIPVSQAPYIVKYVNASNTDFVSIPRLEEIDLPPFVASGTELWTMYQNLISTGLASGGDVAFESIKVERISTPWPFVFPLTQDVVGLGSSTMAGNDTSKSPLRVMVEDNFVTGASVYYGLTPTPSSGGVAVAVRASGGTTSAQIETSVASLSTRDKAANAIIQLGGNYETSDNPVPAIVTNAQDIATALGHNRFIHAPKHHDNAGGDGGADWHRLRRLTRELRAIYPGRVQDVALMFRNYNTGLSSDNAAQQNDQIPPSLAQDTAHPNLAGNRIIAKLAYEPWLHAREGGLPFIPHQHLMSFETTNQTNGGLVGVVEYDTTIADTLSGVTFTVDNPNFSISVVSNQIRLVRANSTYLGTGYYQMNIRAAKGMNSRKSILRVYLGDLTSASAAKAAAMQNNIIVKEGPIGGANTTQQITVAIGIRPTTGWEQTGITRRLLTLNGLKADIGMKASTNHNAGVVFKNAAGTTIYNLDTAIVAAGDARRIDIANGISWLFVSVDWANGVYSQAVNTGATQTSGYTLPVGETFSFWHSGQSNVLHKLFGYNSGDVAPCDAVCMAVWPTYVDFSNTANRDLIRNSTTKRSVLNSVRGANTAGQINSTNPIIWFEGNAANWQSGYNRAYPNDKWDCTDNGNLVLTSTDI